MIARLRTYASFVRFTHSVFALPFALAGALLASRLVPVAWTRIGWIVLGMVAARSAAMGFNRLVDARFDARNPRTAMREIPRGLVSPREAVVFVVGSSAAFVVVAAQLGLVCLLLSPVALAIVFWYSLAKRYTAHTQAFLGLAMAVAPVGGWIAAGGPARLEPWLLGLAIGAWVAGFDILYACQDVEFDRARGLHSVPARFGVPAALGVARVNHVLTAAALAVLGAMMDLGAVYWAGWLAVVALLVYEHSLVRPGDLSRLDVAFFNVNGYIAVIVLVAVLGGLWL
jgi:4-hydroxybenzoate polyprenyltransferase